MRRILVLGLLVVALGVMAGSALAEGGDIVPPLRTMSKWGPASR